MMFVMSNDLDVIAGSELSVCVPTPWAEVLYPSAKNQQGAADEESEPPPAEAGVEHD